MSGDAGIESRTLATVALTVRSSGHLHRPHIHNLFRGTGRIINGVLNYFPCRSLSITTSTTRCCVFLYNFNIAILRSVKWNCSKVWLLLRAERSPIQILQICIDDNKTSFLQLEMFLVGAGITSTEKTHPLRHAQEKGGGDKSER